MPKIELITEIKAPIDICFDLSRSIDLHKRSVQHTKEEAIDGITSGLIGPNEFVTWRAKHFGIWLNLTSKITEFNRPYYFVDEMVDGLFKSFRHEHHLKEKGDNTILIDYFSFQSPLGLLGSFVDMIVMEKYMTKFLKQRNKIIKEVAESGEWRDFLSGH